MHGEARPDDPTEEDVYPDHMLLPDGRTLEDVGHAEWKRHVWPFTAAEAVRSAAAAVKDAEAALTAAVAAARMGNPPRRPGSRSDARPESADRAPMSGGRGSAP